MKTIFTKILCWIAPMALAASLTSAADEPAKDTRPVVCIDAQNIIDKTSAPRPGGRRYRGRPNSSGTNFSALVDRMTNEFVQTGLYRVLNMEDAAEALKKDEVFKVITDENGNKLSIPTPGFGIKCTVVQYGVHQSAAVDPVTKRKTAVYAATVEIILTVVDLRTGETVISKNLPPVTSRVNLASSLGARQDGNYQEQALQSACREVAKQTVQTLIFNTEFFILDVSGGNIEVDIPASVARPGQIFTVYKYGAARVSRRTGKKSYRKIPLGKVVLTKCDEESAMARPLEAFSAPVTTDCVAMWTKSEELPPPPPPVPSPARPF